jgi:hypothetical protein
MLENAEKNFAMRLISRLDDMELSMETQKLLIVGHYDLSPYYPKNKWTFGQGNSIMMLGSANYRVAGFLHMHGFCRTLPPYPTKQEIIDITPDIDAMPVWPDKECIKIINGVLVIKLSNQYDLSKNYPEWSLCH